MTFDNAELTTVSALNDEADVRAEALATDYLRTDLEEATLRIARLLLLRSPEHEHAEVSFPPRGEKTPIEALADRLRAEGLRYRAVMLANWLTSDTSALAMYPLFLYNTGYGKSRAILERVLCGEKWAPPYLYLAVLNMLHQSVGLSHDALHRVTAAPFEELAPWINRLFCDDAVFDWFERKRRPLRFYGGVTNTVIGLYDEQFADPNVGTEHLARGAERAFDLGGGFNTSEIERLVGRPFVSADLITPRLSDYDGELILIDRRFPHRPAPVATEAVRREFLAQQARVAHLPFDVFSSQFPTDAESYVIVSTGFMTSTLRARPSAAREAGRARLGTTATSVYAILRVMELVARGKSVDLFTIQRATSRLYHYKTCLLQWRGGRLTRLQTTPDGRSVIWKDRIEANRKKLRPGNARFAELAKVSPPPRP